MKNSLRINFKKPDDFSCKRILELRGIDSRTLSRSKRLWPIISIISNSLTRGEVNFVEISKRKGKVLIRRILIILNRCATGVHDVDS